MILDTVRKTYTFPFEFFPYQDETVAELGPLPRAGYYLDPGTGKTAVSTASALYRKLTRGAQAIVAMPPILLDGWARWLASIKPDLKVTIYRGSPKKRQALDLSADFILVSLAIFKLDFDRFDAYFRNKPCVFILDEFHQIEDFDHVLLFPLWVCWDGADIVKVHSPLHPWLWTFFWLDNPLEWVINAMILGEDFPDRAGGARQVTSCFLEHWVFVQVIQNSERTRGTS